MAAKELYDYLTEKTATKDVTLTVEPRGGPCRERIWKNEIVHNAVDGSAMEVLDLSGGNWVCFILGTWNAFKASDAGTLMQMYCDSDYGNGQVNTWYLQYSDGHTYVVRFAMPFERVWLGNLFSHNFILRVTGYKAD